VRNAGWYLLLPQENCYSTSASESVTAVQKSTYPESWHLAGKQQRR
jgi:hypothetical protein